MNRMDMKRERRGEMRRGVVEEEGRLGFTVR